jgi:hypothetical protein
MSEQATGRKTPDCDGIEEIILKFERQFSYNMVKWVL